uniref:Tail tube protein n=1 Tax=Myoviridae sp. ct6F13 TaxID=2827602 RepID=A0A8S5LJE1_9CAUD|nr:MAG TPA: hypothetical protein [Myoviridae sp. ct6F13]
MGIRKRSIQANYLKVNDMFELLGTGFTELNESPSAQTTSKRYINQVSATQSITGYEWSISFNTDQIASDKAIEYIRNIGEMLLTGADTETEYIIVDLDKKASEENKFRARKFKVAIAVDSFDDNDGELGISGTFLGQSDPIEGTFDTSTKTFEEGFTKKVVDVAYSNTGSVTEISVSGITFNDSEDKFKGVPFDLEKFTFKDNGALKTATLGSSWTIK